VVEQKQVNEIDDETLIMADVAQAVGQIRSLIINILSHKQHHRTPVAESLADLLSSGVWTHDYPISVDDARKWVCR
jgi:hypothetical protein